MKETLLDKLWLMRTELQRQMRNREFAADDPTGAKLELVIKALELAICVAPLRMEDARQIALL